MAFYTTGEIAKLCNISVRTVQFYDTKGILQPSELSDGGRRLYSEVDLNKMKVICFLKECNFSLENIAKILKEENSKDVIDLLLETEKENIKTELLEKKAKLDNITNLQNILNSFDTFSLSTLEGAKEIIESKKHNSSFYIKLFLLALPITIFEWMSILFWIFTGNWWLFVVYTVLAIPFSIIFSKFYLKNVAYICPNCNNKFKPKAKEAIFANHTPKTRKLVCPECGKKSFCIEIVEKNK